jgi:hypothetical protein
MEAGEWEKEVDEQWYEDIQDKQRELYMYMGQHGRGWRQEKLAGELAV